MFKELLFGKGCSNFFWQALTPSLTKGFFLFALRTARIRNLWLAKMESFLRNAWSYHCFKSRFVLQLQCNIKSYRQRFTRSFSFLNCAECWDIRNPCTPSGPSSCTVTTCTSSRGLWPRKWAGNRGRRWSKNCCLSR